MNIKIPVFVTHYLLFFSFIASATEVVSRGNHTTYNLELPNDVQLIGNANDFSMVEFDSFGISKAKKCDKNLECVLRPLNEGSCAVNLRPQDNGAFQSFEIVDDGLIRLNLKAMITGRKPVFAGNLFHPQYKAMSVHLVYDDKDGIERDFEIGSIWASHLPYKVFLDSQFPGYKDAIAKTTGVEMLPPFEHTFSSGDFTKVGSKVLKGPTNLRFAVCEVDAAYVGLIKASVDIVLDNN